MRERDNLAAELRASYPRIASWLGEVITKIAANDREIDYVNGQALPTGAERLRSAELVARDVEAWRVNQTDVVRTRANCVYLLSNTTHTGGTHGLDRDSPNQAEPRFMTAISAWA
jgi:hypothetical protein